MSREWQPGDVAMVTCKSFDPTLSMREDGCWRGVDGVTVNDDGGLTIENIRALVVIDPEDLESVERLYNLYYGGTSQDQPVAHLLDTLQAALREFANPTPPKPQEPTRLGALVEEHGARWTHVGHGWWVQGTNSIAPGESAILRRRWSDLGDVTVLSEGVAL